MCSQRMCSHTSSRLPTAREKLSANTASVAALIGPAEVPQAIGNGFLTGLPRMSRTAFTTPTWYAARSPPPVNTSPARGLIRLAGNGATLAAAVSIPLEEALLLPARGVRVGDRDRGHVDDAPHRGRRREDVHRARGAEQDRAYGDAAAGGRLQQVEGDVRGIQRGHHEEVRLAAQPRARQHPQAEIGRASCRERVEIG